MVFVCSNLLDGEPNFTLSQVALNDLIMMVAFAPVVALLLGPSSITVPWDTLLLSAVLYIVVPVIMAQLWRAALLRSEGQPALKHTLAALGRMSLCAMLLYGSPRERSYWRLLIEEAALLLQVLGAQPRIFDPREMPVVGSVGPTIPRCRSGARFRYGPRAKLAQ